MTNGEIKNYIKKTKFHKSNFPKNRNHKTNTLVYIV